MAKSNISRFESIQRSNKIYSLEPVIRATRNATIDVWVEAFYVFVIRWILYQLFLLRGTHKCDTYGICTRALAETLKLFVIKQYTE